LTERPRSDAPPACAEGGGEGVPAFLEDARPVVELIVVGRVTAGSGRNVPA
jgi:hypothetical protein